MVRIKTFFKTYKMAIGSFLLITVLLATFQNCGQVSMMRSSAASSSPVISMSEFLVTTTLNQAKTIQLTGGSASSVYSFEQTSSVNTKTLANAIVSVDSSTKQLTFTPNRGFRGDVNVTVYSTTGSVTNIQQIKFEVQNPLLDFKPAMAVRGPMCLTCHANVQGDMISDYGFKGTNDAGPDLFFSTISNVYSIYGVAYQGPSDSLSTSSIVGRLIIPNVQFANLGVNTARAWYPSNPGAASPAITNLSDYITRLQPVKNSGFQGVTTKNSVYIGAPTAADIKTAGSLSGSTAQSFYPNTATDAPVSGLNHVQSGAFNYYTNAANAPLVCEGDLFIDGVVFLKDLNVKTTYGCRIYATRTVFINGPIIYTDVSALSNLQITSAIGVYMGFGYCVDCANSDVNGGKSSLQGRLNDIYDNYGAVLSYRTQSFQQSRDAAFADQALVSAMPATMPAAPGAGVNANTYYNNMFASQNVRMLDASNSFVSQDQTTYSRLLLNAPVVMSRYKGNYQGMVIAEYALWRLGAFTFTFDPVFTGVSLLPFLDFTKILDIR